MEIVVSYVKDFWIVIFMSYLLDITLLELNCNASYII